MSVLPNANTGNPHTDFLFRLIDEKLSELFCIHGQATYRYQPYSQADAVYERA